MGSVTAENFGIEKVIVNVLANPKINCLIVCGEESDHLAGQSLISLAENGVSTMAGARKIIGSDSPLPYLNEISMTAISRFLREIKVIDLVGNKDTAAIQKAIDSCTAPARSEAHIAIMPEIDENTWKKCEKLVTQNVMSKIKLRAATSSFRGCPTITDSNVRQEAVSEIADQSAPFPFRVSLL